MPDLGLFLVIVFAVTIVSVAALIHRITRPQPKQQLKWPDRPVPLPRPEGGHLEQYQVVVDARPTPDDPVSWRVVESTDKAKEAKAGRKAYLKAGYRAGIVADGVFRG